MIMIQSLGGLIWSWFNIVLNAKRIKSMNRMICPCMSSLFFFGLASLVQGVGGMAYGDPNDDIIITTLAEVWWVGPNMPVVMSIGL